MPAPLNNATFRGLASSYCPFFMIPRQLKIGEGNVILRQTTAYPYQGTVKLEVISSSLSRPVRVRFVAPSWTKSHQLRFNGKDVPLRTNNGFVEVDSPLRAGDWMALDFDLVTGARDTFNPYSIRGYHAFHAGPLVLGYYGPTEIALPRDSELYTRRARQLSCEGHRHSSYPDQ